MDPKPQYRIDSEEGPEERTFTNEEYEKHFQQRTADQRIEKAWKMRNEEDYNE